MWNHINAVGVELEGTWLNDTVESIESDLGTFVTDGSVHRSNSISPETQAFVGECKSYRLLTDAGMVERFMREYYPDYVNKTCGLHVHTSMKTPEAWAPLFSPKFWEAYQRWIEAFAAGVSNEGRKLLGPRLAGENQYCERRWRPDSQFLVQGYDSPRYAFLNYSLRKHGTLEHRTFCMFPEVDEGVRAVLAYLDFVDNYVTQALTEPEFNVEEVLRMAAPVGVVVVKPELVLTL